MGKRIFTLLFYVVVCISVVNAHYVKDMPTQITQPNGQIINCFITGDEYYRRVYDENGFTVIRHPETGYIVYAILQNDELVATNYIVGQVNPTTVDLVANQDISATKKMQKREFRQSLMPQEETSATPKATVLRTGTLNNITIYLKFSDGSFTHTKTAIEDLFNNPDRGASLFAYYRDISDEDFNMVSTFYPKTESTTVLAYTDTEHSRSYYQPYNAITNPNGYTDQYAANATGGIYRLHELMKAAINNLKPTIEGDFTASDLDNATVGTNNRVDNITFVIQGSSDDWSDVLWPHRYSLYNSGTPRPTLNGKTCYDYFLVMENHLFTVSNGHQSVLCHEMYHVLGAPDLYRYEDATIDPVEQWDIMCQNAVPPQHSTAYIADKYGKFIPDVPEITACGTYTVYPLWDRTLGHNIAYKIRSSLSTTQWYYIEYRKKTGEVYESSNWITGQGIIIYRVNTAVTDGNASGPPDEVYVFRPGGTNNTTNGTINNAYFSSQSGRTTFNSTSNPKCFIANNTVDNIDISMISASGGDSMTFYVNFPIAPTANFSADNITIFAGETVNFTNLSSCATSYSWDFGDGNTSSDENPSHTFQSSGTFTVVLTATNSHGTNTYSISITVNPTDLPPVANFTYEIISDCNGQVNFTNTSLYYSTVLWDLGDGNTSTTINPQYTYSNPGNFTVSLTVANQNGEDTYTLTTPINITMPVAPTTTGATNCNPVALTLTASGTGTLNWYDTQFGGNIVNTGTSFTNMFSESTTYYVENDIISGGATYNVGRTARGNNQQSSYPTQQNSPASGIVFNVLQPIKLVSVQVYANQAVTNRIIRVLDENDNILKTTTVNIPVSVNTPATITLPTDWDIPIGTGYKLVITNSRYIYRTTGTTLVAFPYTVDGVISLTGPTPTTNNYYNTFYNWIVQTVPDTCKSARTPVTATIEGTISTIVSSEDNTTFCEGGSATITASLQSGWTTFFQGTTSNGTSMSNPSNEEIITQSGTYYFRARNVTGCWGEEGSINITVNPLPNSVEISDNGEFCGSTIITATGGEGGTIYWQGTTSNGTSITDVSSEQTISETGTYYFRARTALGCWGYEGEISVTINDIPSVSMENIIACDFPIFLPAPEYFDNYQWYNSESEPVNSANNVGQYSIVVIDINGCTTSDFVTLDLFSNVFIGISSTPNTNLIENNGIASVILSENIFHNILWSTGDTTSTITNLAGGIYYVTISNDEGCQIVESVVVDDELIGINSKDTEIDISIFPNPNSGQFTIEINKNIELIKYQIIDDRGAIIIENNTFSNNKIEVSMKLASGYYFIKIFSKNNTSIKSFIVK